MKKISLDGNLYVRDAEGQTSAGEMESDATQFLSFAVLKNEFEIFSGVLGQNQGIALCIGTQKELKIELNVLGTSYFVFSLFEK